MMRYWPPGDGGTGDATSKTGVVGDCLPTKPAAGTATEAARTARRLRSGVIGFFRIGEWVAVSMSLRSGSADLLEFPALPRVVPPMGQPSAGGPGERVLLVAEHEAVRAVRDGV